MGKRRLACGSLHTLYNFEQNGRREGNEFGVSSACPTEAQTTSSIASGFDFGHVVLTIRRDETHLLAEIGMPPSQLGLQSLLTKLQLHAMDIGT